MELRSADDAEQHLWTAYRDGAADAHARLLEQYLPLARRVAASLYARRAVDDIEFGDYLHLAYTGLLEAMQRYRYTPLTQFATFATYRIRGAVLNGVPRMTEVGDQIATLRRLQRERARSLRDDGTAVPTHLAGLLELVVNLALTVQLDELGEDDAAHGSADDPYASCEYDDLQQRLRQVVERLPERERTVVYYHYFHQMQFEQIADVIGLSKSRVSRLHKEIIERIRDDLRRQRLHEIY